MTHICLTRSATSHASRCFPSPKPSEKTFKRGNIVGQLLRRPFPVDVFGLHPISASGHLANRLLSTESFFCDILGFQKRQFWWSVVILVGVLWLRFWFYLELACDFSFSRRISFLPAYNPLQGSTCYYRCSKIHQN